MARELRKTSRQKNTSIPSIHKKSKGTTRIHTAPGASPQTSIALKKLGPKANISKREISLEPAKIPPTNESAFALQSINSAITYLVAFAASKPGDSVGDIIAKLPKLLPEDFLGLSMAELDKIGLASLPSVSAFSARSPIKIDEITSNLREIYRTLTQLGADPKNDNALNQILANKLLPRTFIGTSFYAVGALGALRSSITFLSQIGTSMGLLPSAATSILQSIKNIAGSTIVQLISPTIAYVFYRNLYTLKTFHDRQSAFQSTTTEEDLNLLGDINPSDEIPLSEFLKEYNPEFYKLIKRVVKFQSGTTLLSNFGMDTMRGIAFICGAFLGDKSILNIPVSTMAHAMVVIHSVLSLLQYKYNQSSEETNNTNLQQWSALAPELKNPTLDENAQELLHAHEQRRFIASGLIELEQMKAQGITLNAFQTPKVAEYLKHSQNENTTAQIKAVTQLLKADPNISKTYTPQQIHTVAMCLVVQPEQYRTKKINRLLTHLRNQQKVTLEMRKDIEKILRQKAESMTIKLDSAYAVSRLHHWLQNLHLSNYPETHPIRQILNLDTQFLKSLEEKSIDETLIRNALRASLRL